MDTELNKQKSEHIVQVYFKLIEDLRSGKAGAVEALLDLWEENGTFEFAGAPPVVGTFQGKIAIHTLYKNRFHASGMKMRLTPTKEGGVGPEVALGVVHTDLGRIRVKDGHVVAGWTSTVGTQDGRGFSVTGTHTFVLHGGKIRSLKIVMSQQPAVAPNLKLEGLGVEDIGRLALAAWPIVV